MDPLLPADTEVMEREADKDSRRKIQFSVPSSVPTQLDPGQIRRRRPTPATLFRLTDQPSPEEDSGPHQWVLGENGALRPKLVHMSTYQPPSLKAVQRMAQAHFSSLDMTSVDKEEPSSGEEEEHGEIKSQQKGLATDLREESKLFRDQCAPSDISAASTELSLHCRAEEEEAKDRQEGKQE
ncbi:protein phosphatase 1 regulatory subunit 1B-like isoform X2 [Mastacembelus armatus]|uniref:protein phosphatase 1 regulatory subunit 1B-like isoform X2 n=1 Tax=Mastacembelus armatus TaxID=205130 RepID=UPI000E45AB32|nr:protein phosphatase 1 regulatory subunit 1B-like isoform X2 [Mastacembelus armatus]